jgi:hypothetical protein
MALQGRTIANVITNGNLLVIQCEDGTELMIAWVDESGRPVKGIPKRVKPQVGIVQPRLVVPAG